MSIPGLNMPAVSSYVIGLDVSSNTPFDLAAAFGNPSFAIRYRLYVPLGVVRGSSTLGVPAIDATGLHEDSTGTWFVDGVIAGRGGRGGVQVVGAGGGFWSLLPGGPGGGAGETVGAGGDGLAPATDGSPGTLTTGGAPGTDSGVVAVFADTPTSGENGSDAVWTNHAITATVTGGVRGGGGGGGYALPGGVTVVAQDGGDLDQNGVGAALYGLAGKGVLLLGTEAAFSWSGAGTVGLVSA